MEILFIVIVYVMLAAFYAAPIASIIFFIISLINYRASKKALELSANDFDRETHKKKLSRLILSVIIAAVVIIGESSVIITFLSAIAYM
ncbi:MAG: hypothetical protein E7647_01265 [Ruminococcaceae bacterium]|nr:hypothetical protein [Oscillospiraceae bacterium]